MEVKAKDDFMVGFFFMRPVNGLLVLVVVHGVFVFAEVKLLWLSLFLRDEKGEEESFSSFADNDDAAGQEQL